MTMKKILTALFCCLLPAVSAFADEGMWMLPLIQKMNGKALEKAGCLLSPGEIYSVKGTSLKDAVVHFGGGCTGEIVSGSGLVLTNHHCGYSSIQKLSSVDHDYLADGYWAMDGSEELPVEGLTVTFLESMTDITGTVEKMEKKFRRDFRDSADVDGLVSDALYAAFGKMTDKVSSTSPSRTAVIQPFYDGNVWYMIVYKVFKDIRFVGAPPSSIGKFGADTDNWMWPRHTCDFSIFRVYADKDNNPAEFSPENVPYRPAEHLSVSLNGVREGDFTMIMGYPASTSRFETSPELRLRLETNDIRIAVRTVRQEIMLRHMLADPAVKIQYASKYSGSSNGWKKWKGMKLAFERLDIIRRAEEEEAEFNAWTTKKPSRLKKYGGAVSDIASAVEELRPVQLDFVRATESIYNIEIMRLATIASNLVSRYFKEMPEDSTGAMVKAAADMDELYRDYCPALDREVTAAMLSFFRDNAGEGHGLTGLGEDFCSMDIPAYVGRLFDESIFASKERLDSAFSAGMRFDRDPAFVLAESCFREINACRVAYGLALGNMDKVSENFTEGVLLRKKGQPTYPDANATMRLTWGKVLGYSPSDAVSFIPFTTLDGVMEKEDPDNWEFVVPERLKQLWKDADFGEYARSDGKMPACFLSNNDITGGNSGSPVLNARGELVGLAFDGNWESMSSDVMFEPDLQRCICVDIRYVLFIIDKFGGARWIVDEINPIR